MKKIYITPALEAVKIETAQVICGSPTLEQKEDEINNPDDVMSNKFQGGLLWEDDEK